MNSMPRPPTAAEDITIVS